MKFRKKYAYPFLAFTVAGTVALSGATLAAAAPASSQQQGEQKVTCVNEDSTLESIDVDLMCKIISVADHLEFSVDENSLTTDLKDQQLTEDYGFTERQVADFRSILNGTYEPRAAEEMYAARSARFYISNSELQAGAFAVLATAASAGPEALAAAFVGVSSMMGGPVGTAISGGVALLGAGFFIAVGIKITGALAQGKGVAFYPQWDFPPLRVEIE